MMAKRTPYTDAFHRLLGEPVTPEVVTYPVSAEITERARQLFVDLVQFGAPAELVARVREQWVRAWSAGLYREEDRRPPSAG